MCMSESDHRWRPPSGASWKQFLGFMEAVSGQTGITVSCIKHVIQVYLKKNTIRRLSVIGGLDYWNGLLEWTTGMDFDLYFLFYFFTKS